MEQHQLVDEDGAQDVAVGRDQAALWLLPLAVEDGLELGV
jgi:hypothetical protein